MQGRIVDNGLHDRIGHIENESNFPLVDVIECKHVGTVRLLCRRGYPEYPGIGIPLAVQVVRRSDIHPEIRLDFLG